MSQLCLKLNKTLRDRRGIPKYRHRGENLEVPRGGVYARQHPYERSHTVSLSPEDSHANAPLVPVDLWSELNRLGRSDDEVLAAHWAAVRRSRLQRRARARAALEAHHLTA